MISCWIPLISIISNDSLREDISRLYEFDYKGLVGQENAPNDELDLNSEIGGYLKLEFLPNDSSIAITMDLASYQEILVDKALHVKIATLTGGNRYLLEYAYLPTRTKALGIVERIDEELVRLPH